MKTIKKIVAFTAIAILAFSCKKDVIPPVDTVLPTPIETEGLTKVQDFTNATHTIELYTKSGDFKIGHNVLFMRVKNTASQAYEPTMNIAVNPMMHMMSKVHSCPVSDFTKTASKTNLYDGFIIFQIMLGHPQHITVLFKKEIIIVGNGEIQAINLNK